MSDKPFGVERACLALYSWNILCLDGTRAFLHFVCASLFVCIFQKVERRRVHHLSNESWPRLEGVVSPFFSCVRRFFQVTDVPALVRCHCRYGATSPASLITENFLKNKCEEPRWMGKAFIPQGEKMDGESAPGSARHGKKNGSEWRALVWCSNCSGCGAVWGRN